jgi:protein-tyrosine phosphatase
VCLGNICRSPTAEGVMRSLVASAGAQERVQVDSAGTGGWHVGSAPDARAGAAAAARGIRLTGSARRVRPEDYEEFDLLLAMDASNLSDLRAGAPGPRERAKVRLLREFDPASAAGDGRAGAGDLDVPDPYYGGERGFEHVLDLVTAACQGLLAQILAEPPA